MRSISLSHWHLCAALISAVLMLQPTPALAAGDKDETWYQIEVIIAKRGDHIPTLETFALQPAPITWHQGRSLTLIEPEIKSHSPIENVEFIILPVDQRILNNEARTLDKNPEYEVLVHQSWRQILKGNKAITWIDIKAGNAWAGHQHLEGSVGFSKGRYLHIFSELHLNQFPTIKQPNSQPTDQHLLDAGKNLLPAVETRYSLIQRRKMRSNELHYLDHPKLVLLVKVIPYTPAEPILEAIPANTPILVDLTAPSNAD
jgi:hypothetical protein